MNRADADGSLPLIARLLLAEHELDPAALESLRKTQFKENVTFEESLIRAKLASEQQIAEAYAQHYFIPLFQPREEDFSVDPAAAHLIPPRLCRDHLLTPIAVQDGALQVAFFSPDGLLLLDELKLLTGMEVTPLFASLTVIERLLGVLFEEGSWVPPIVSGGASFEDVEESREADDGQAVANEVLYLDQLPPPGRDGRIIRYVNQIFEKALEVGASDIHIEPFEAMCRVRLRVDGALTEIPSPPLSMFSAMVARIKVLAKMDIAEKRLPQDGAVAIRSGERRVDMRVSTCPTVYGEKVVLRVLDKSAVPLQLAHLGMDARQDHDLTESIQSPHGLVLVTGPTGSGKSTTLYSCLSCLNQADVNICTVEDPVEYKFPGVNQVQTRSQMGLTFASALRSFLRQDPDIIMVGEIRDSETAEICLRAALTGHLVLSTLHTNDALSAVTRLNDMGIEPFLLASTLRVVVAQRLIRRLCGSCRKPDRLDEETARRLHVLPDAVIYRPVGCKLCHEAGYKGRLGIFEVIRVSRRLADLIQRGAPTDELRKAAVEQGMTLLAHSATAKVCEGQTSLEEAIRATISEEG